MYQTVPFEGSEHNGDRNFLRYAGYQYTADATNVEAIVFSDKVISLIQEKANELLRGVNPDGRDVVVMRESVRDVLDGVWTNYKRRNIGDIYSIFNIPASDPANGITSIIDQTVELIVSYVKNDSEMRKTNANLTVWSRVLGDFNLQGLRSHDVITGSIRSKRPDPMQFHMNY
jgi:hypothetical protein